MPLTCQEFVELATSYLEGALPAGDRAAFEEHIAHCEGCERYLHQLRRTIDLLGAVPDDALSEPARQELLDAFADWKHRAVPQAP
jgi:anti-sigma factor RsiW